MKRKLKEKLDKGTISQGLYDEIVKRWDTTEEDEQKEKDSGEEKENQEKPERTSTVSVKGLGQFVDVFAREFHVSGSAKVSGNIDVSEMEVSGAASVEGNVKVSGELDISGYLLTGGRVVSNSVDLAGRLEAEEIKSKKIDCSGWLNINRNIMAESVDIDGRIDCEIVDCGSIDINIGSTSGKIGILKCDRVTITRQWRRFHSASIEIDEITCRTADLEGVKAKKIVGEDIILGDGCEVDYVEAGTLKLSENAVVRKKNVKNVEA